MAKRRRGIRKCELCDANQEVGYKFCLNCGRKVNYSHKPKKHHEVYCPHCSTGLLPTLFNDQVEHRLTYNRNVHCPKCGRATKILLQLMD